MRRAGAYLRANKARFALNATREMGKPIGDAEAEVEKCAWACDFYAEHAEEFLADEHIASTATDSYIAYQPLGVVLAVMPWNFPYWQVFRFAAPALMAGNAGVLKHASNVTRCALDIEETFRESGFPAGTFTTLIVPGAEVKPLIADDRIAAVTITGSEPAGVSVASESGQALKKHVLELGGSDAFIVLADADLAAAAKTAAKARFQNAGQSCICGKRFIVEEAIYDRFVAAFIEESKAYASAIPRTGRPPWDRWPAPTCATTWSSRSTARSRRARASCWAAPRRPSRRVLRGHRARRRRRHDAGLPRRNVRPGRGGDSRARRRACHRARERFDVRPGRCALDRRRRTRQGAGAAIADRRGVHQRHDGVGSAIAVRRR